MNKRVVVFLLLAILIFIPLAYVIFIDPSVGRPHLIPGDWRPKDLWIFISPAAGFILWIWGLYDWGIRSMNKNWQKFLWLLVMLSTLYIGSTIYFLTVGLKKR